MEDGTVARGDQPERVPRGQDRRGPRAGRPGHDPQRRPTTSARSWSSARPSAAACSGMDYLSEDRVEMRYTLPMGEIVFDFFDQLKSRTKGYASLDYERSGEQAADLVKVDILLQGEPVDAFSRDRAPRRGVLLRRDAGRQAQGADPAPAVRGADPGRHRRPGDRPREHPRDPQGRARQVLRRRHHPQAQAAGEAEGGQEADEDGRPRRGPPGGLHRRALQRADARRSRARSEPCEPVARRRRCAFAARGPGLGGACVDRLPGLLPGPARRVGAGRGRRADARLLRAGGAGAHADGDRGGAQGRLPATTSPSTRHLALQHWGGRRRGAAAARRPAPARAAARAAAPRRPDRPVGPRGLRGRGRLYGGCTCPRRRSCARSRRTSSGGPPSSRAAARRADPAPAGRAGACRWPATSSADPASTGTHRPRRPALRERAGRGPGAVAGDRPQADVAATRTTSRRRCCGTAGTRWSPSGDVRDAVRRRFHTLVDAAGLDEDRARDWVVVRMVLNAHWAIEDAAARPTARWTAEERDWITRASRSPRPSRTEHRIGRRWTHAIRDLRQRRPARATRRGPASAAPRSTSSRSPGRSQVAPARAATATRSPTPGTTAGSTRRSTRSPARTSTAGRPSSATEIRDGQFGENLTTVGHRRQRGRGGGALADRRPSLLEVASVRIPCNDFKSWMGRCGYDNARLGEAVRRRGPARALPAGARAEGVLARRRRARGRAPARPRRHRVSTMFRALTTERALLPELLRVDGLVAEARVGPRSTSRTTGWRSPRAGTADPDATPVRLPAGTS